MCKCVVFENNCLIVQVTLYLFCDYFDIFQLLSVRLIGKIVVSFLLGLTPYLYLPLSAHYSKGRWTWGDQRTFHGFVTHVLRQEYGTFNLVCQPLLTC